MTCQLAQCSSVGVHCSANFCVGLLGAVLVLMLLFCLYYEYNIICLGCGGFLCYGICQFVCPDTLCGTLELLIMWIQVGACVCIWTPIVHCGRCLSALLVIFTCSYCGWGPLFEHCCAVAVGKSRCNTCDVWNGVINMCVILGYVRCVW